eukprot:scaffold21834_cov123-Isochrysis_galbana.AAC.8
MASPRPSSFGSIAHRSGAASLASYVSIVEVTRAWMECKLDSASAVAACLAARSAACDCGGLKPNVLLVVSWAGQRWPRSLLGPAGLRTRIASSAVGARTLRYCSHIIIY